MIAGIRLPSLAFWRRLPVQVVFLMTLALFPLGLISLYQTGQVVTEARAMNQAALTQQTLAAGAGAQDLIQTAIGATKGLGLGLTSVSVAKCGPLLTRFVADDAQYAAAWQIGPNGAILCYSDGARRLGLRPGTRESQSIQAHTAPDGSRFIIVTHKIGGENADDGWVSVAIPAAQANAALFPDPTFGTTDLRLAILGLDGTLIAASHGLGGETDPWPRRAALERANSGQATVFTHVIPDGERRLYSVVNLAGGQAALIGSWPTSLAFGPTAFAPIVLPVLMWFASMAVAYFGLRYLVVRHITRLKSAMLRYALGELRGGRIMLDNAPTELREAETAFNRMILLLARAEAQLEQDIKDKEVLLKEVHHRVKNNLQLIASIINMQARGTKNSEARGLLRALNTRVLGLATMHQSLTDGTEQSVIDAHDLVGRLVADVTAISDDKRLTVKTDLSALTLLPEQASPFSMLVAETLTNAVKYVGPDETGQTSITVSLHIDSDGWVHYGVENTRTLDQEAAADDKTGSQLGTRLIRAFEQQLAGSGQTVAKDEKFHYNLSFPVRKIEASQTATV